MFKKIIKRLVFRMRGSIILEDYIANGLTVGENFNPQLGVELDYSHCWLIEIGNNVTIAPHAQILAHDASTCAFLGYAKIGRVSIGNNVFIGAGAIILPGTSIGNNVIIGAGAVVSHNLKDDTVYAGNPAVEVCSLEQFLDKHREKMKQRPLYGEEYTLRQNISSKKKAEQKAELMFGIGYVK